MIDLPSPEQLFAPGADAALLQMPPKALVAQTEAALEERDLFCRAAKSGLYRRKWKAAGVRPERLRGRDGLRHLPFLDGGDLVALGATGRSLRRGLLARPRTWIASRGTAGAKKWLPLTLGDVAHWFRRVRRVNELLAERDRPPPTRILAINEPMPRASNALPYLWERADYLAGDERFEFVIAAMEMLPRNHWDRFAVQKDPHWLLASVGDARRLAETLGNPAAALPSLRRGVFWGGALDGLDRARAELAAAYGLEETFALYLSAECREMYVECPAHAGLHLWLDGAIHEVLPDGADGALFVDQAPPGVEGEYLLTTLGQALPLLRYRTGDRIRVESTAPCSCGLAHPRVHFLGRYDTSPGNAKNGPEAGRAEVGRS